MQLQLLTREITPHTVLDALVRRPGAANGASAKALASEILGTTAEPADERRLRQVIEQLRNDGHAVCATPESGYHHAADADDLNRTCVFLTRRAVSTLRQVAAMKRVAMPDLYGQLGLPDPDEQGEHDEQRNPRSAG
ncbi:hypothetical protein ACFONC_11805 [Luteimonas soli]|uniref:Uncharacterized protein n=1 Tax=Luteimonas soli TaxID=1648966 RepID=A0ABV7XL06_9GAMM